jgi:hypothetical protein
MGTFIYQSRRFLMLNRNKVCLTLALAVSAAGWGGALQAADIEDGIVKRLTQADRSLAGLGHNIAVNNVDLSAMIKRTASGAPLAPAQGISYYEVYAVASANYGTEYVSSSATTTTGDHGGTYLYAYTLQYGYGNPNPATLNGVSKSFGYSKVDPPVKTFFQQV